MGGKRNIDAFIAEYARNGNDARKAYSKAYPSKTRSEASTRQGAYMMMKNPNVQTRLEELRQNTQAHAETSIQQISERLDEAYSIAKEKSDAKAMTTAAMGKAKLHGFLVERTEAKHTHEIGAGTAREIIQSLAAKYLP